MNRRQALAAKRALLVVRSDGQRRQLATSAGDVAYSLRAVDTAVGMARRTASHPLLLAGAVIVAVVVVRPRRWLQGLSWGLSAAVVARRVAAFLRTGV